MDEKRELVAFLAREYGFQFVDRKYIDWSQIREDPAEMDEVYYEIMRDEADGEHHGQMFSRENMCLVSPDGWAIPVRDALSDIVAAAERALSDMGQSFLAELNDGETMELMEMVCGEIAENQYYPYPTVGRGDREFGSYVFDMAVLCDRPEEVKKAAQNLHSYILNVNAFGGALRDAYKSPFWLAVTLEETDIRRESVPRMAVEVLDDLDASSLGLDGSFSIHFPRKISFEFDGTEDSFAEAFSEAMERLAGEITVSGIEAGIFGAGGLDEENCLEMVRQLFREETERMIKDFRTNYFEDRNAGEWWRETLGANAEEIISYIRESDARSRAGILKEMYKLHTVGREHGLPGTDDLELLREIGAAFEADSHQGVAKLAFRIRDAAERGLRASERMEFLRDTVQNMLEEAVRDGDWDRQVRIRQWLTMRGCMPDVRRLDAPVALEVFPTAVSSFRISLDAAPEAYREKARTTQWPPLEKLAESLEQKQRDAERKEKGKGREVTER